MAKITKEKYPGLIKAWSFSRLSDYQKCPAMAKFKYLDKIANPDDQKSEALKRGARIHELAEGYLKGTIARLPKELKSFEDEFKKLRRQYKKKVSGMTVEDQWAFTQDWQETDWFDMTNCWLRIKLDCAHHEDDETLIVTDWKTGKFRESMNEQYVQQLELYALASFLLYDHIQVVKPRLVYIDQQFVYPEPDSGELVFMRDQVPALTKKWEKAVKPMLSDKVFRPRPGDHCRWCFYKKSNAAKGGGQCKF